MLTLFNKADAYYKEMAELFFIGAMFPFRDQWEKYKKLRMILQIKIDNLYQAAQERRFRLIS